MAQQILQFCPLASELCSKVRSPAPPILVLVEPAGMLIGFTVIGGLW